MTDSVPAILGQKSRLTRLLKQETGISLTASFYYVILICS